MGIEYGVRLERGLICVVCGNGVGVYGVEIRE